MSLNALSPCTGRRVSLESRMCRSDSAYLHGHTGRSVSSSRLFSRDIPNFPDKYGRCSNASTTIDSLPSSVSSGASTPDSGFGAGASPRLARCFSFGEVMSPGRVSTSIDATGGITTPSSFDASELNSEADELSGANVSDCPRVLRMQLALLERDQRIRVLEERIRELEGMQTLAKVCARDGESIASDFDCHDALDLEAQLDCACAKAEHLLIQFASFGLDDDAQQPDVGEQQASTVGAGVSCMQQALTFSSTESRAGPRDALFGKFRSFPSQNLRNAVIQSGQVKGNQSSQISHARGKREVSQNGILIDSMSSAQCRAL